LEGLGVGVVFGLFGAGWSAFATPVLSLLGVPGMLAVGSPLPALVPAAVAGARRHLRAGNLDRRTAWWSVAGGLPGAMLGTLVSEVLGGFRLLALSGVVLVAAGLRVVLPDPAGAPIRAARRRQRVGLVAAAAFIVGVLTGVLANGGGFLLVPLFVVAFGLRRPGCLWVAADPLRGRVHRPPRRLTPSAPPRRGLRPRAAAPLAQGSTSDARRRTNHVRRSGRLQGRETRRAATSVCRAPWTASVRRHPTEELPGGLADCVRPHPTDESGLHWRLP
jgi:hypothetical protein